MRLNQQREKMSSSCRHAGRSKTCPELRFTNSNGFLASKLLQTIANDNCFTLSRRRLAVGQALGFQETGNQEEGHISNNDASIFVSFCLFSFLIRFMFVHAAFSDPPSPGSPRSRNHTLLWIQRATATTRRVANEEALLHAMMAEMGSGREPKDSVMVKY